MQHVAMITIALYQKRNQLFDKKTNYKNSKGNRNEQNYNDC